jgi:FO synthase
MMREQQDLETTLALAIAGERLSSRCALSLGDCTDMPALLATAARVRDIGHGNIVSYSPKVFIPLTRLCRDVCHYCTFARTPDLGEPAFLNPEQVIEIARRGAAAGCKEALFTLGDKPELRYSPARRALQGLGYDSTLSYLTAMAAQVLEHTGLLPHINAGVMGAEDLAGLREVSVSQGLMLESVSRRLCAKGGPHHGSPDKQPLARLRTIRLAGEAHIAFTSGILVGIGESRRERIASLLALRALHERYGHIQEIIIQNFRAKPRTKMAAAPEPSLAEHLWTIAVARLVFGPSMNIQAPPNLQARELAALLGAGINDWGGVSPVTPDHVNPEAPWPHLKTLHEQTEQAGKILVPRLALYPSFMREPEHWLAPAVRAPSLRLSDSEGFARSDQWYAGTESDPPSITPAIAHVRRDGSLQTLIAKALGGKPLREGEIAQLFTARGGDFIEVCAAADRLRHETVGDEITYVVNRNINYTNVCYFRCQFCAFSKGRLNEDLRGRAYDLTLEEIERRAREAWARGATEVCLQGGIHPHYTGATYVQICRTIKQAVPQMHVHAFSPLEVWQGAQTLGVSLAEFLAALKQSGLGSLPGTAAEILDDEIRGVICPDKINSAQWLQVMEVAHGLGLRTTATIMFGHMEQPLHWARHLLKLRELQSRTGGFTEFVPLPFVHMEAPLYRRGKARAGPTFREAVLMHAVARLVLHPQIRNIHTSWVKMGPAGITVCLRAGANDLGGTLMNETITRSAGARHGQEMPPQRMEQLIGALGRTPVQRTTLYALAPAAQTAISREAPALATVVNTPARRYQQGQRPLLRAGG